MKTEVGGHYLRGIDNTDEQKTHAFIGDIKSDCDRGQLVNCSRAFATSFRRARVSSLIRYGNAAVPRETRGGPRARASIAAPAIYKRTRPLLFPFYRRGLEAGRAGKFNWIVR